MVMNSPPGGSCAAGQKCNGGSLCRDGWCICPDTSMVVSKGTCTIRLSMTQPTVSIGNPCGKNRGFQAQLTHYANMID